MTHATVEDRRIWGKMKLNELGCQKLCRQKKRVSRHSMLTYILTGYRIRKREPLIALGSHQRGLEFLQDSSGD